MKSTKIKVEIDCESDRLSGMRPVAVTCIVRKGRILFLFKRDHNLWQLPQGGIEPNETIFQAIKRELAEELGSFSESIKIDEAKVIGSDLVEFPKENQGSRDITTVSGDNIHMRGKKYYFVLLESDSDELPISESEFEKYRWVTHEESDNLVRHIYQKGKKRITIKALEILSNLKLI